MTETMKQHLEIITEQDGKTISRTAVEDPFHTTRVHVDVKFGFLDWLRMAFHRTYKTEILVKVRGDHIAHRHWFSTYGNKPRPTIEELQAILDSEQGEPNVVVMPDGSCCTDPA